MRKTDLNDDVGLLHVMLLIKKHFWVKNIPNMSHHNYTYKSSCKETPLQPDKWHSTKNPCSSQSPIYIHIHICMCVFVVYISHRSFLVLVMFVLLTHRIANPIFNVILKKWMSADAVAVEQVCSFLSTLQHLSREFCIIQANAVLLSLC